MKRITTMLAIGATALFFTACGGGSSGDNGTGGGGTPTPPATNYHFPSGTTTKFTLSNDENIIIGRGCTYADVYDSDNVKIGSTNAWSSLPIPEPLTQGDYTASFSESYNHTDSIGVLYYASSGFTLDILTLNSNINVLDRKANIYKFNVDNTSSFVINTTSATIEVYDSSLNSLGSTSAWADVSLPDPLTLDSGVYYFVSSPYSCKDGGGGSFSITPL